MYWHRTNDGGIVNLALAEQIRACPPEHNVEGFWELRAYFSTGEVVLVVGTREECGQMREQLYARLKDWREREDSY